MTAVEPTEYAIAPELEPARPVAPALIKGARGLCPACGKSALYRRYLKVEDQCTGCGEELHHHRADDAPPYFTIFMVGHIVVPMMMVSELWLHPPLWVHMALWPPLTLALALLFLPRIKGVIVALQWALRMHGFDPAEPEHRGVHDEYWRATDAER